MMRHAYYRRLEGHSEMPMLAVLDLMPVEHPIKGFLITRVNVPFLYRRKGHGTSLLLECLTDADKTGTSLMLIPLSSDERLSYDALAAWYRKHGFTASAGLGYFLRTPKKRHEMPSSLQGSPP